MNKVFNPSSLNEDSFVKNLSESIKEVMLELKEKDFFVTQRNAGTWFIQIFGDAIFTYDFGILLVERFYKGSKCNKKGKKVKTISDDDKKNIIEFTKLAKDIPNSSELSEEEQEKYLNTIKEYQDILKNVKPEIKVLEKHHYKDIPLASLSELTNEEIDIICESNASFACSFLMNMSWGSIFMQCGLILSTVESNDYIDLILIPTKVEGED